MYGTLRLYIMLQLVAHFPSHETGESKLQRKKENVLIRHPREEKETRKFSRCFMTFTAIEVQHSSTSYEAVNTK